MLSTALVAAGSFTNHQASAQTAAPSGDITLEKVQVTAAAPTSGDQGIKLDGSAVVGYASDTISEVGPLGRKDVLDTPYSINVISHDLVENVQAPSPDLVIQMNPESQLGVPSARGFNVTATIRA
jgi:iron complex outermembrane receptor protein